MKKNIEIKIGSEHIFLNVPDEQVPHVRDTELAINRLFDKWRIRFPMRSESQLLAMIAYQYASFYAELQQRNERAAAQAADCLQNLESITEKK